jgi:hypothetical protein
MSASACFGDWKLAPSPCRILRAHFTLVETLDPNEEGEATVPQDACWGNQKHGFPPTGVSKARFTCVETSRPGRGEEVVVEAAVAMAMAVVVGGDALPWWAFNRLD